MKKRRQGELSGYLHYDYIDQIVKKERAHSGLKEKCKTPVPVKLSVKEHLSKKVDLPAGSCREVKVALGGYTKLNGTESFPGQKFICYS